MRPLVILPLLALSGCPYIGTEERDALADPDGDGVPWNDYLHEYGVRLGGASDCIEVDAAALDVSDQTFTFDVYLKGGVAAEQADDLFPLLIWPGRVAFYEQAGRLYAGPPDNPVLDASNSSPRGFMDGGYHHVAFTHSASAWFDVFVDGRQARFGSPTALGEPEGEVLCLGCWPELGVSLPGVVGEARLYGSALYDGSFDPEWTPYATDAGVLGLWHLDEGAGSALADAAGMLPATLVGAAWEHFDLACLDPSTDCGPDPVSFPDEDNDGFGTDEDCDDADGDIRPGTNERCNGYDDDCDGYIDDDDPELDGACAEEEG